MLRTVMTVSYVFCIVFLSLSTIHGWFKQTEARQDAMLYTAYSGVIYFLSKEMYEQQCGTVEKRDGQQNPPSPNNDEMPRNGSVS